MKIKKNTIASKIFTMATAMILTIILIATASFAFLRSSHEKLEEALGVRAANLELVRTIGVDLYQALSAERSIFVYEKGSELYENQLKFLLTNIDQINGRVKKYEESAKSDFEVNSIKECKILLEAWNSTLDEMMSLVEKGDAESREKASLISSGERFKKFRELEEHVDSIGDEYSKSNEELLLQLQRNNNIQIIILVGIILAGIGISIVLSTLLIKRISKNVKEITDVLEEVKKGNFNIKTNIKTKDELQYIGESTNSMISNTKILIDGIRDSINSLVKTSGGVEQSSNNIKIDSQQIINNIKIIMDNSMDQVENMQHSNKKLDILGDGIESIASSTGNISNIASETKGLTNKGMIIVDNLTEKAKESNENVQILNEVISAIRVSSNEITKITENINGIASQTNLLALNASIEAARAGEHGRGFAIVASEIGTLADQSSILSNKARVLIDDMEEKSIRAVNSVEEMVKTSLTLDINIKDNEKIFTNISGYVTNIEERLNDVNSISNIIRKQKDEMMGIISTLTDSTTEATNSVKEVFNLCDKQVNEAEVLNDELAMLKKLTTSLEQIIKNKLA